MKLPLVTHVLWNLGRAGAERMVFDVACLLPERGFRVRVIAAAGGGVMEQDFRDAGIPLVIGPEVDHAWQRGKTVRFLKREMKRERPAIWHTHLGADIWGGMAARQMGIHPWIITAHGSMQEERWPLSWLRRRAYQHADHLVSVSEDTQQRIAKQVSRSPQTSSVIRLGVDTSLFAPRPRRERAGAWHIVSVGRLVESKNQLTLLRALLAVDADWRLTLVGDGPLRAELEAWCFRHRVNHRVVFAGSVADVRPLLADADLFCFASRHEGQGIAVLEAAASGVPVIASDLKVFHEAFDEESMTFVSSEDVIGWTRAMEHAMRDPWQSLKKAQMAREIVVRSFSVERMVQEYAALYRSLL